MGPTTEHLPGAAGDDSQKKEGQGEHTYLVTRVTRGIVVNPVDISGNDVQRLTCV